MSFALFWFVCENIVLIFIIISTFLLIGKNVALWKSTNQSSNYIDGTTTLTSDKAVDGNADGDFGRGTCTHTAMHDYNATWNVNLENAYYIIAIKIKNRNDDRKCDCFVFRYLFVARWDKIISKLWCMKKLRRPGGWTFF